MADDEYDETDMTLEEFESEMAEATPVVVFASRVAFEAENLPFGVSIIGSTQNVLFEPPELFSSEAILKVFDPRTYVWATGATQRDDFANIG